MIDSTLSTEKLTEVFGKSRQAFYQMEKRPTREMIDNEILLVDVKCLRREQPRLGTRKLYHLLAETQQMNGIKIGRDKFFTMLRDNNLLVKRRRKHVKTTDSVHLYKKYSNLIKAYVPSGPEQIFVSAIACYRLLFQANHGLSRSPYSGDERPIGSPSNGFKEPKPSRVKTDPPF